jgi:hypothetical protein
LKEPIVAQSRNYRRIFLKGLMKIVNTVSVRIAGASAEIRTEHLPNTSSERFFLICAVGLWVLRPVTGLLYQPRMIVMVIVDKLVE